MAPKRPGRKRRLASLICAAALLWPLLSCDPTTREAGSTAGWFDPEPVLRLELGETVDTLLVTVELPAGYRAADDFVQRLTLRSGAREVTAERDEFDEPFSVPVPGPTERSPDATIEILIGFCPEGVPDVCYVDRSQLPVVWTAEAAGEARGSAAVPLRYRPEPPR